MKTSDSIKELIVALSSFQAAMPSIEKTGQVQFGTGRNSRSYKYMTLDCIIEAIKGPLNQCGLSFTHIMNQGFLECVIMHKSGQVLNCGGVEIPTTNNMQDFGKALTYARRYTLCAALGIAADTDTDGNNDKGEPISTDTRPWLNKDTEEWDKTVQKLGDGSIDLDYILSKRRVNKKDLEELKAIVNAVAS